MENNSKNLMQKSKVFPHNSLEDVQSYMKEHKLTLEQYCFNFDQDFSNYLSEEVEAMLKFISEGLNIANSKANSFAFKASQSFNAYEKSDLAFLAYAFSASRDLTANIDMKYLLLSTLTYYFYYQKESTKQNLIVSLAIAMLFDEISFSKSSIKSDLVIASVYASYVNESSINNVKKSALLTSKTDFVVNNSEDFAMLALLSLEYSKLASNLNE